MAEEARPRSGPEPRTERAKKSRPITRASRSGGTPAARRDDGRSHDAETPPDTTEARIPTREASAPPRGCRAPARPRDCASSIPERRPRAWSRVSGADRRAQDRADEVGAAGEREHQQRERHARREAEGRDRDAPTRRRDADAEPLSAYAGHPAREHGGDERAGGRRRTGARRWTRPRRAPRRTQEERARHPEDHRDGVHGEDPEQRGLAADELEPLEDRAPADSPRPRSSAAGAGARSRPGMRRTSRGRRPPPKRPWRSTLGERRPGDAGKVEDDVLDRDRGEQLITRDELRRERVACRTLEGVRRRRGRLAREQQRQTGIVGQRVQQQHHRDGGEPEVREEEEAATVDGVGDPPATIETVTSGTKAAIPTRPTMNVECVSSQT